MRVTDTCSGAGGWALLSSHQKGKAYLEEAGGWLEKFHLSFCSPSLAGSGYKAGVGNRCWPGWQQLNPPPATGTECGAWWSSRGLWGQDAKWKEVSQGQRGASAGGSPRVMEGPVWPGKPYSSTYFIFPMMPGQRAD